VRSVQALGGGVSAQDFTRLGSSLSMRMLQGPSGLALDPLKRLLYVTDAMSSQIRFLRLSSIEDHDMIWGGSYGSPPPPTATPPLSSPHGIAVHRFPSGCQVSQTCSTFGLAELDGFDLGDDRLELYVADTGNHVVRGLFLGGDEAVNDVGWKTLAGAFESPGHLGDGGVALGAQLHSPYGVALVLAPQRRLYVADAGNHAVRVVDFDENHVGSISTVAGILGSPGRSNDGGPATAAQLYFPYDVALASGSSEKLYIADNWNHAVRMVDLRTGLMITVAGVLGSYGRSGDLGLAGRALLHSPTGVAVDNITRDVYIADSNNHAIRLVSVTNDVRRLSLSGTL